MSLPKSARTITLQNKTYKWMVGKHKEESGLIYADVHIEHDGKVKSFEECLGHAGLTFIQYPVTPNTVKLLILANDL